MVQGCYKILTRQFSSTFQTKLRRKTSKTEIIQKSVKRMLQQCNRGVTGLNSGVTWVVQDYYRALLQYFKGKVEQENMQDWPDRMTLHYLPNIQIGLIKNMDDRNISRTLRQ